jgi:hypothetical protein
MSSGWIKLHRQLTEWEWYDDINTSRLYIHLLLTANHKDNNWRGITIKRGSRLTSLDKLSSETSLSVSKIRTSVKKLILTDEIASESHTQHTVFIVKNYESYQGDDKQIDKPVTNESQTNDKPIATNNNVKNEKNVNKTTKEWVAPDNLNPKAWDEFVQHRKEINKSMTNLSKTKAANQICGLSFEQQQATVDKSISSKWAGLFPEKQIQTQPVINKNSYRPMPKPGE